MWLLLEWKKNWKYGRARIELCITNREKEKKLKNYLCDGPLGSLENARTTHTRSTCRRLSKFIISFFSGNRLSCANDDGGPYPVQMKKFIVLRQQKYIYLSAHILHTLTYCAWNQCIQKSQSRARNPINHCRSRNSSSIRSRPLHRSLSQWRQLRRRRRKATMLYDRNQTVNFYLENCHIIFSCSAFVMLLDWFVQSVERRKTRKTKREREKNGTRNRFEINVFWVRCANS